MCNVLGFFFLHFLHNIKYTSNCVTTAWLAYTELSVEPCIHLPHNLLKCVISKAFNAQQRLLIHIFERTSSSSSTQVLVMRDLMVDVRKITNLQKIIV